MDNFNVRQLDNKAEYNKFNNVNNNFTYTECGTNIISRTYSNNNLTELYFSNNNINLLHEEIQKHVYFTTNQIIGKQSNSELQIIMKSIYLSNRPKLTDYNNIINQVKFLNKLVIQECVRIININVLQHKHYIEELNKIPDTMNLPKFVSSKGTKNLEMYK